MHEGGGRWVGSNKVVELKKGKIKLTAPELVDHSIHSEKRCARHSPCTG